MLLALKVSISALVDNGTVFERWIHVLRAMDLYRWVLILLVAIFLIAAMSKFKIYGSIHQWIVNGLITLRKIIKKTREFDPIDHEELNQIIDDAGYAYDIKQDVFYSILDPWQREMGYCRLYDEAAAPMGIIMDCEPIYFSYGGKKWLIEFWKGQYDLTTGCEIGIYATKEPYLDIPSFFTGTFYHAVGNQDLLRMALSLKKNGRTLFTRYDRHWWLTGFKVGEFSEPSELTMDLSITLKNKYMLREFVKGLEEAGYSKNEYVVNGNKVGVVFNKPHTPQPITRTEETDWLIQKKNKLLCDIYQDITRPYDNFLDKINAIGKKAPEIYNSILNMGKGEKLFSSFQKIKDYLS